MLSFLASLLPLAILFIGRVQATCNCSTLVVPFACTCNQLTSSASLLLALDCNDGNLSDLGFLTSLSEEEKQCVEHLDVSGNIIHHVRAADLLGYSNLKELSLAANRLVGLEQDVFMNVPSLERLNLSANSIHQLPSFVFRNLSNLRQLSLSHANLTSFPDLSGLSNLTILQLDNNAISTINSTKFEPLEGPSDWQDFDLTGNPLICDCQLTWIVDWLLTYSVAKMALRATCAGPTSEVTGRLVGLLKRDQFACDQDECLEQNGGCEHICNNTYGSYECLCRSGYMVFNQSRCGIPSAVMVNVTSDDVVHLSTLTSLPTVITLGGNVTLTCVASGVPTPSVQWSLTGNADNFDQTLWPNGRLELQLNDVQLSVAGQYHCSAQNPLGFAQAMIELEVWPESDPPEVTACSNKTTVTPKGEFRLPQHSGVEKFLQLPCPEGPLCGESTDAVGVFKCSGGAWHDFDTERCQYSAKVTRDLQCLSEFSVNDSNSEWVAKQLRSHTIEQNMHYLDVNFAIDTLESILTHSTLLSAKAVEHIIYATSQLMAALELSTHQTRAGYSNRLSASIHRIAHLEIDYLDSSYMLSIDSPLLQFDVASAGHLLHLDFNKSNQASVRLPAGLLRPGELEGSASGSGDLTVANTRSYVSLPGNTGYLALYHSDVLFQNGTVAVEDTCQLDDCYKQWQDVEVNALIVSAGTGRTDQSQNQSSAIQLEFQPLQDGVDPLCVHWDYGANDGNGGWSCTKCSLKVWLHNKAICECTAASATYTVLMTNCNGSRLDRCQCRGVERGTLADVGVVSGYISITALALALIVLFISRLKLSKVSRQFQVKFNIAFAALWVAVMYIISVWPDRDEFINTASCKVVASLLHYFLTALFLWLAADAYVAFTTYVRPKSKNNQDSKKNVHGDNFVIKAATVCWGIPILVISVCHIIGAVLDGADCYMYGATVKIDPTVTNGEERAQVCWIKSHYVVLGVLAAPASVVVIASAIIYCYALNRKSNNKDWPSIVYSLVLVLLIGVAWAFGFLTLTNHTEFSHSTCKSFSVFYYFYGVTQAVAAVSLLIFSCFITDEVKQFIKAIATQTDDIESSASEERSDVLSFLSGLPQAGDAEKTKKKKRKGLRAQTSSGYVKSGDEIPLETLVSLMPFSMDLGQHHVASPAIRESVITEGTEGKAMTVDTRSLGEGQSFCSSWKGEEDGDEQKLIVDVEEQDEIREEKLQQKSEIEPDETEEENDVEKQDETEKQDGTQLAREDEETMEKKNVGYDGDESSGDTTESGDNDKPESRAETDVNSSVTETRLEFREDGVYRTDTENDSPSSLLKQQHRKEVASKRATQPIVSLESVTVQVHVPEKGGTFAVATHGAYAQQAVGKAFMEDEESEGADRVSELPGQQDSLARNIRELDDMLSISQASLLEFEESVESERPSQTVPLRTSRSAPTHLSHVVYPQHHAGQSARYPARRDRSVRKLLVPPKPGAILTPVSSFDTRGHRNERAVGSHDSMVITEVQQPRRRQPPSAPPGSQLHYERKMMGQQRALVPYPKMYEAHQVRRPQAYPFRPRPQYYPPDRRDDYRYYRQPIHHPSDGYYNPQRRRSPHYDDQYYEMRPPPRQYYRGQPPGPRYYNPEAYPQRHQPRPGRVVEYSYITDPVEFMDGHMFESRRPPRPVTRPEARQKPARRASPSVAYGGYRQEKMDQLFFFPGSAQETKTLEEGLHGEEDDSAVDTWYDDQ